MRVGFGLRRRLGASGAAAAVAAALSTALAAWGQEPSAPAIVSTSQCTWRQFDQGAVAGGGVQVFARISNPASPPLERWEFSILDAETNANVAQREVGAAGRLEAAATLVGLEFGRKYRAFVRAGNPDFGPWSSAVEFVAAEVSSDC
jgi:hypothetical protein